MKKNGAFSGIFDRMVSKFVPQEDTEARLTMTGAIAVLTNTPEGKCYVDKDGNIYDEDFLIDFPVFTVAKSVDQVKVGDVVKLTKGTFATVTSVENGKVETLSFGGQHRQAKAYKNIMMDQPTVRVVANFCNGFGDNANMAQMLPMLALLNKDGDEKTDLGKIMMFASMANAGAGVNPFGNMMSNPLSMAYLLKGDGDAIQTMMLANCMQNGGFANMFGGVQAPAAPAAPVAEAPQA